VSGPNPIGVAALKMMTEPPIVRALDARWTPLEDVSIDHRLTAGANQLLAAKHRPCAEFALSRAGKRG